MVRAMRAILCLVLVAGCGSTSTGGDAAVSMDAAATGDMVVSNSRCGFPGDTGNSLGVGQYCTNQGPDCPSGGAHVLLCSALTNGSTPSPQDSYFCSFQCQMSDPPGVCGENATCLCDTRGCACIPTRCIPDAGA
jgi:hypothetical protein